MELMVDRALLLPAAVLIFWSLIMLGWMALTRLPAMEKAGVGVGKLPPGGRGQNLEGVLPAKVNWKAHNYVHLMEQPTLFYAVVLILTVAGIVSPVTVGLAWGYVGFRIVHSIWQATVNVVKIRFLLFAASSACLIALSVIALIALV